MQLPLRGATIGQLKRQFCGWRHGLPRLSPGAPTGVTVFANARINKQHHNPASHHECKNARHRDSAATCTYRRTLVTIAAI